jgi:hypothetical protein
LLTSGGGAARPPCSSRRPTPIRSGTGTSIWLWSRVDGSRRLRGANGRSTAGYALTAGSRVRRAHQRRSAAGSVGRAVGRRLRPDIVCPSRQWMPGDRRGHFVIAARAAGDGSVRRRTGAVPARGPGRPSEAWDLRDATTRLHWTAELARLSGHDTVGCGRAAAGYDQSGTHHAAYCRWRGAQVALANGRGPSPPGCSSAARDARQHVPLTAAILRRRGPVPHETDWTCPDDARGPTSPGPLGWPTLGQQRFVEPGVVVRGGGAPRADCSGWRRSSRIRALRPRAQRAASACSARLLHC